jgi:UDP-N-acetylmuramate dehydrogenase
MKSFKGKAEERVGMKRHTTFKIGGMAEVIVWPQGTEDLETSVELANEMKLPWRVLGNGSNLLVGDGGVEEVLIKIMEAFPEVEIPAEDYMSSGERGAVVRMAAGVKLAIAVKQCQMHGLAGVEWAAGIPGTVGGAVIMNAGSMGSSISDVVKWVEWYRPGEGISRVEKKDLVYEYRRLSRAEDAVVVACAVELSKDDPRAVRERIVKGLKRRRQTQPLSHPSAGSVFKNPPGDYAGRLIESVGLKGERIGDAQISDVHANFIVNRGRARSRDVLALIDKAREKVTKSAGVELELEIEVIGGELP